MIEHIQPESLKDFEDRRKVAELCSSSIAKLYLLLEKLEEIRDIVEAIDVPALSSYKKIQEISEEAIEAVVQAQTIQSFKPPQKKDLTSLTLTLAKNLQMQLGNVADIDKPE